MSISHTDKDNDICQIIWYLRICWKKNELIKKAIILRFDRFSLFNIKNIMSINFVKFIDEKFKTCRIIFDFKTCVKNKTARTKNRIILFFFKYVSKTFKYCISTNSKMKKQNSLNQFVQILFKIDIKMIMFFFLSNFKNIIMLHFDKFDNEKSKFVKKFVINFVWNQIFNGQNIYIFFSIAENFSIDWFRMKFKNWNKY